MIFLYVFIFNLPTGESAKLYRHEFKTVAECNKALVDMRRPDKNVLAYCAPDSERYYNATWFKDRKENLK